MIVVGYLYNKNGMATWCIEAALALHMRGANVVLIKSKHTNISNKYPIKVIDFEAPETEYKTHSLIKKIRNKIYKYINILPYIKREDSFLPSLHQYLQNNNIVPECYLLNQSSYVNRKVQAKQYVVAWAYKPFLKDYLRKAFLLSSDFRSLTINLYDAIFWNKIDWQGFKEATGVMAVSQKLAALIKTKSINVVTVYPGTNGNDGFLAKPVNFRSDKAIRLAMMAVDLDDPRKGLRKIVDKLRNIGSNGFQLTLIGGCGEDFKKWVLNDGLNAVFTGLLTREAAIEILSACDVLLFGSLVDDWGFVQVEAMSRGMAVLSPNASPFDEIVSRSDYLYDIENENDLELKLKRIISADLNTINEDKVWFKQRYETMFSLDAFSKQLFQIIKNN